MSDTSLISVGQELTRVIATGTIGPPGAPGSTGPTGPRGLPGEGDVLILHPKDFGADPTGVTVSTSHFADMNAEIVALGAGVTGIIELEPHTLYKANLDLDALVNIRGAGRYSSRLQGVPGAGVPVLKKNCYDGDFVRDLGINGTHPWDGTTPGGNSDPEAGLYLHHGGWWSAPNVERVQIALARGIGYANYTQGAWSVGVESNYNGGRSIDTAGGSTDCIWIACLGGPSFANERLINAIGLANHWMLCKANVAGIVWDVGLATWKGDNTNTTAVGWALGTDQDCDACISEDNPIGVEFFGDACSWRGLSAGDRIPVIMNVLDSVNDANNVYEAEIRCNDRFVPVKGAQLTENFKGKVTVNIDWESTSASGPMAETGTKIKDKVGFKVFDDLSPGFGALYNANEYKVRGEEGGDFWDSTNGALTPDLIKGTQYFVNMNGDITVNAFVHRSGLAWGKKLRFIFSCGGTVGRKVTFNSDYNHPTPVLTLPSGVTVVEFTQVSPSFTPTWKVDIKYLPSHVLILGWSEPLPTSTATLRVAPAVSGMVQRQQSGTPAVNDEILYDVLLGTGTWQMDLWFTKNIAGGIITPTFDGIAKTPIDQYQASGSVGFQTTYSGIVVATPGLKRLSLKVTSKNASATNYFMFFSTATFTKTA